MGVGHLALDLPVRDEQLGFEAWSSELRAILTNAMLWS